MNAKALPILLGSLLVLATPAVAQLDPGFMPKGGKTRLLELLGAPADAALMKDISGPKRAEEAWRQYLAPHQAALGDKGLATLAAYLAVNLPLPAGVLDRAARDGTLAAALPPDGRDLAWNGCQSCHSLFTGYLTQDRDLRGWQNEFLAPFHRELNLTAQERDEFCRYSAINMPMKIDDVPPDLRF